MPFNEFHAPIPVNILSSPDSASLRQAYLNKFVDTDSEHYRRYIGTTEQFSDGVHYIGYIWDCIRLPKQISYHWFCRDVMRYANVYAFADDHSRTRVVGAPLWPYPPNSVISIRSKLLLQLLPALPEDLYVFDESVSWSLVLTHEEEGGKRICLSDGNCD